MQMLWSLGYLFQDKYLNSADDTNPAMFKAHHRDSPKRFYNECCTLWKQLQNDHCYPIERAFASTNHSNMDRELLSRGMRRVPHAVITPLRIVLQPMHVTRGHRAMRRYSKNNEYCWMLVYIRDEDGQQKIADCNNIGTLKERYKLVLELGFCLRIYLLEELSFCYFGSSGSQVKKAEFWFMAPVNTTPDEAPSKVNRARAALGDFRTIKNVATYIARVGLYLTTSKPTAVSLISNEI